MGFLFQNKMCILLLNKMCLFVPNKMCFLFLNVFLVPKQNVFQGCGRQHFPAHSNRQSQHSHHHGCGTSRGFYSSAASAIESRPKTTWKNLELIFYQSWPLPLEFCFAAIYWKRGWTEMYSGLRLAESFCFPLLYNNI